MSLGISKGGPGGLWNRENTTLRGVRIAIGPRKHVTSRGPGRNRTGKTRHFEGSGSQSDRGNTSLRFLFCAEPHRHNPHPIIHPPTSLPRTRPTSPDRSAPSVARGPQGTTSVAPCRQLDREGAHRSDTRHPGGTRKTRHFEGSGSQSDLGKSHRIRSSLIHFDPVRRNPSESKLHLRKPNPIHPNPIQSNSINLGWVRFGCTEGPFLKA